MSEQIINNLPDVELIASKVHDAWWEEKKKNGFHAPVDCPDARPLPAIGELERRELAFEKHCDKCHPDMYPYNELSEGVKEYDRKTVETVYNAIKEFSNNNQD